jgi:hypothetical protein
VEEAAVENAPTIRLHRSAAAGLAQDPFDLADRNSKDLGDLKDGHGELVAQRRWLGMALRGLVRAGSG